jgi:hypothetical protein
MNNLMNRDGSDCSEARVIKKVVNYFPSFIHTHMPCKHDDIFTIRESHSRTKVFKLKNIYDCEIYAAHNLFREFFTQNKMSVSECVREK